MDEHIKRRLLQNIQSASRNQQSSLGASINGFMYRLGKTFGITALYTGSWLGFLAVSAIMIFLVWPFIFGIVFFIFVFVGSGIEKIFELEKDAVVDALAIIGALLGFFVGMGIAFTSIEDEWKNFQEKTGITWFIIRSWLEFFGFSAAMIFLGWPLIVVVAIIVLAFIGVGIEKIFELGEDSVANILAGIGVAVGFFAGMGATFEVIENKWKELQDKRWR